MKMFIERVKTVREGTHVNMKQDTMIDYKNNTILIIDDDAAELRTVAYYLEEYDFEVITAGSR